jgi:hypothetical protein
LAAGRTTRRFEDHTKVWPCSPFVLQNFFLLKMWKEAFLYITFFI